MIIKIAKLKNLGIFHDYKPVASTPDFNKYNLLYGWNGSGKTTLSRLFAMLDPESEKERYPDTEYCIVDEGGAKHTHKSGYTAEKVMVFNQDYVTDNAPTLENPNAKSKHIFLLGKDDKELAKKIDEDKTKREEAWVKIDPKDKKSLICLWAEKDKTRTTLFKNTADTIAAIKGGAPTRNYNRTNAIAAYGKLSGKQILSESDLAKTRGIVEQTILEDVNEITLPKISISVSGKTQEFKFEDFLAKLNGSAEGVLSEAVQQAVIKRLKDNEDIAEWVSEGMTLHDKHKSGVCEYCGQPLTKDRLEELGKHFNEEYSKLISKIETQIKSFESLAQKLQAIEIPDKANLYIQYQEDYDTAKEAVKTARDDLAKSLGLLIAELEKKRTRTHEKVNVSKLPSSEDLNNRLKALNSVIDKHNKHTKSFQDSIKESREKLEKHYVSLIFDEVREIDDQIKQFDDEIKAVQEEVDRLDKAIQENESTIRNSGAACVDINKCLEGILGRNELVFEDQDEGYLIKRNGVVADNLSEGEKTAISFAYFVIHLNNKDFNIKEGIVVIDDPISSLDVEGIFRVCTLLDTKLKSAKQLFILTHNFDFFNQIKKWFINDPSINGGDESDPKSGAILMLKTCFDEATKRRAAYIDEVDPLLADYESEYHYLFKKLADYKTDTIPTGRGTIEAVYHYPNMARKVLECFLSFRIPIKGTMYTRMLRMKSFNKKEISTADIKEVYDFINSNSHLDTKTGLVQFDPKLGVNGEKYIDKTLTLIEKCDEKHFKAMMKELKAEGVDE